MDAWVCDVTDEAPFYVVVANAGGGRPAKLGKTTLAMWNETLAVTLTGVLLTFREAMKEMPVGGRLIAIGSTASLQGRATIPDYAAAKHGVLGLVRSVAQEVAERGITCNAGCPGFVAVPMAERAAAGLIGRFSISREEAEAMLHEANPVGRMITAEEVASAVLYLASPGAAMVNGHALSISGGEL